MKSKKALIKKEDGVAAKICRWCLTADDALQALTRDDSGQYKVQKLFDFTGLQDCREPFHGGSFFDHEGLPYCETHYHAKRGSLCAGCSKPITGRCITAMFKKFHPEHFVCAFCLKQLNKGTFKEQNDKPYCHQCFDKLFG
ncbi:paxillin-like [Anopheles cruzii]|uniref:paxillin-like n=1 Tax=Anopheles cruzii TaxID=68878 RepID=UPI0022EC3BDC|nr:paxillin-like [Anopheles cruzii]